jgi:hypothetical protein
LKIIGSISPDAAKALNQLERDTDRIWPLIVKLSIVADERHAQVQAARRVAKWLLGASLG